MARIGRLFRSRRDVVEGLAWDAPNLACTECIGFGSPVFETGQAIPSAHASQRAGGRDVSPALDWAQIPTATAQLLLVVQDPNAPTRVPFVHCLALLEPSVHGVPEGGLNAKTPGPGVRLLRSSVGRGYYGPAPITGDGPHRYAFQLFALRSPVVMPGGGSVESAKPDRVLVAATGAIARGRLDGFFERR